MATMRPWTVRILELVDAGVTHREEVIEQTLPFVPIGHAHRARERQRLSQQARPRLTDRTLTPRPKGLAEVHRIGARTIIRETIATLLTHGHLVREGDHLRRPSHGQRPAADPRGVEL
jgi:hypothetical protein